MVLAGRGCGHGRVFTAGGNTYCVCRDSRLNRFVCVHVCHVKQACAFSWSLILKPCVCVVAFELCSLWAQHSSHGWPVDVFSGLKGAAKMPLQTL